MSHSRRQNAEETRKVLVGHANGDITTHYSAAEFAELIEAADRIDAGRETPAITLPRASERKSPAEVEQSKKKATA